MKAVVVNQMKAVSYLYPKNDPMVSSRRDDFFYCMEIEGTHQFIFCLADAPTKTLNISYKEKKVKK